MVSAEAEFIHNDSNEEEAVLSGVNFEEKAIYEKVSQLTITRLKGRLWKYSSTGFSYPRLSEKCLEAKGYLHQARSEDSLMCRTTATYDDTSAHVVLHVEDSDETIDIAAPTGSEWKDEGQS